MLEDPFSEADLLDCLAEIYSLQEKAKTIPLQSLVEYIVEFPSELKISMETEKAINRFFNTGSVDKEDRQTIENCYILLKNCLCITTKGEIYKTFIIPR